MKKTSKPNDLRETLNAVITALAVVVFSYILALIIPDYFGQSSYGIFSVI